MVHGREQFAQRAINRILLLKIFNLQQRFFLCVFYRK
jgi:hypothetical protein